MSIDTDPRFQDGREWVYKIPETSPDTRIGANLGYWAIALPEVGELPPDPRDAVRMRYLKSSKGQDHGTRGNGDSYKNDEWDSVPKRVLLATNTSHDLRPEVEDTESIGDHHIDFNKLLEEDSVSTELGGFSAHRHILAEQDPDYGPDDMDDPNTPNYDPYGAWEAAGPGVVFEADSAMWTRKKERSRKNPDYMTDPEEDYSDYMDGFHITDRP